MKSRKIVNVILAAAMTITLLAVGKPMDASAAQTGYITADALTVRSQDSKTSKSLGYVHKGDSITIENSSNGFYQITYKGKKAYVSQKYVSSKKTTATATKKSSSSSSKGQQIANYATKFVGNPYRWGGTSLTRGADCSGFIKAVYQKFGYNLPHSSSALRSKGTGVSSSNKKAGDVVCYSGHVALYIGNNKIVHAANTRKGIIISKVSYMKVVAIRRIVK